jgi:hypothetical protein
VKTGFEINASFNSFYVNFLNFLVVTNSRFASGFFGRALGRRRCGQHFADASPRAVPVNAAAEGWIVGAFACLAGLRRGLPHHLTFGAAAAREGARNAWLYKFVGLA